MSMIIFCPVPCESGYMYDCNSGECQQCPHGSYQPQWGQTRSVSILIAHVPRAAVSLHLLCTCTAAGRAPPTPPRTARAPPASTCASRTPAPSTPRRGSASWRAPTTPASSR